MSRCFECMASTPRNYKNSIESCNQRPVVEASPCPCCNSHDFRDDFRPSSYSTRTDCPTFMHAPSVYGLHFGSGYLQDCIACYQSHLSGDCAKQAHRVDGYPHCVDGYNLVTNVDQLTDPSCTCKLHPCTMQLAPLNNQYSKLYAEKLKTAKYGTLLRHCDNLSPSPDCSVENFASRNDERSVKCNVNESVDISLVNEKTEKGLEFQDCSELNDILVWKKKHLDQLQTQVSENNITDELKDIHTSSAALPVESSSPTVPHKNCQKPEKIPEKTTPQKSSGLETSADSLEMLKVELRRQEMKVKLYESMLRKHRRDLETLQSTLHKQKASYEEEVAALKSEVFQLKKIILEVKALPAECAALEFIDKEVQTETEPSQSCQNLVLVPPCPAVDGTMIRERHLLDGNAESNGTELSHENQLSRLQRQIDAEEAALSFLRDDVANKDHNLKTLRATLRELSNCNCELLEKNIELESLLNEKQNRMSRTAKAEALETRLLKDIDACILQLGSMAEAFSALSNGFDPLPLLLSDIHEDDITISSGVTESSVEAGKSRIRKVSEIQTSIDRLRELIIQRILTSHYKQPFLHSHKLTL